MKRRVARVVEGGGGGGVAEVVLTDAPRALLATLPLPPINNRTELQWHCLYYIRGTVLLYGIADLCDNEEVWSRC